MTDDNSNGNNNDDSGEEANVVEFIKWDAKRLLNKPMCFRDRDIHTYLKEYQKPTFRDNYYDKNTYTEELVKKYQTEKLFFLVNYHLHVIYPEKSKKPEHPNFIDDYPFLDYILKNHLQEKRLGGGSSTQGGGGNLDDIIRIARSNTQNSENSLNEPKIPNEFNLYDKNCNDNNALIALIELLEMYLGTLDVIELFKKKDIKTAEKICYEIDKYRLKNKDYLDYLDTHGFDLNVIDNEYEKISFFVGEEVQYNGQRRYIRKIRLYDDGRTVVRLYTRSPWSFFTTSTNSKKTPPTSNEIPIEKIKKMPDKRLYDYYQILGIARSTVSDSKHFPINLYISFARRLYELVRYIFTLTKFKKYVQKYNPADNYIHKEEFEYKFIDFFNDTNEQRGPGGNNLLNEIEAINKKYSEYIEINFGDFHVSNDIVSMLFLYTHHGMNLITKQERVYSKNYVHLNPVNPITTHIQPIEEDKKNASGFNNTSNQNGGGVISTVKDGITYVGDKVLYAGEKMTKGTYDFLWSYNERKNQEYHRNVEYKLYILLDALDIFMNENELKKYKNYYDKYYGNKDIKITPNKYVKLKTGLSFLPSNLSHINKKDFVFENNVIDNKSEHFIENAILSCALPKRQEVYIPIRYNKLIKDSSSPTIHVTLFEDKEVKIHAIISKNSLVKNKSKIIPGSRPLPKELRGMYELLQQGEKAIGVIKNTDDEKRIAYIIENLRNYLKNISFGTKGTKDTKENAETELKKYIGVFYDKNKDSDYLSGLGSHLKWHITREEKIDILYDELIKKKETTGREKESQFTRKRKIQSKTLSQKLKNKEGKKSKSPMFLGLSASALTVAALYHTKTLMKSQNTNSIPSSSFRDFLVKLPRDTFNLPDIIRQGNLMKSLNTNSIPSSSFGDFLVKLPRDTFNLPDIIRQGNLIKSQNTNSISSGLFENFLTKLPSDIFNLGEIIGQGIGNLGGNMIYGVAGSPPLFSIYIAGTAIYMSVSTYKKYMKWKSRCYYEYISTVDSVILEVESSQNLKRVFDLGNLEEVVEVNKSSVHHVVQNRNIYQVLSDTRWREIISVDLEYVFINDTIENIFYRLGLNHNGKTQSCTKCTRLPRLLPSDNCNTSGDFINVPCGYTVWVLSHAKENWQWKRYGENNNNTLYLQRDPIGNHDKYSFFNKLNQNVDIFKTRNYINSLNHSNPDTITHIHTTEFSKHLKMITNKHIFV